MTRVFELSKQHRSTSFATALDSTWAAFFDVCGWEWSYEPNVAVCHDDDCGRTFRFTPVFRVTVKGNDEAMTLRVMIWNRIEDDYSITAGMRSQLSEYWNEAGNPCYCIFGVNSSFAEWEGVNDLGDKGHFSVEYFASYHRELWTIATSLTSTP